MATRGVFQCQRLTLRYCEHGGSSRAVREYLASGRLLEWASERPTVDIRVKVANGKHPNLRADYLTSSVSNKSAMNGIRSKPVIHQVCLKSKGVVGGAGTDKRQRRRESGGNCDNDNDTNNNSGSGREPPTTTRSTVATKTTATTTKVPPGTTSSSRDSTSSTSSVGDGKRTSIRPSFLPTRDSSGPGGAAGGGSF
mmetsp:Transcript_107433/g.219229  ORF Transcript_107433/g.219229 Transcript_107433/m.219229 type:complete len:196 (+) Transcript_107433:90-677(+)